MDRSTASVGRDRLALFLEDFGPILDQLVKRLLRRALVGNDVVMHPLLHVEQELRIRRLGPEVLHDRHRLEELRSERRALGEAGRVDDGLKRRVAADLPPLLLDRRLGEPFDVSQSVLLMVGRRHHRDTLTAQAE